MQALLWRQCDRPCHFEPAEAILSIVEDLPNGSDRVRCYPERVWWGLVWHDGSGPASRDELRECVRGDKSMHGADSHGACERAGLDSGATHVSANNLIRERHADPIEID